MQDQADELQLDTARARGELLPGPRELRQLDRNRPADEIGIFQLSVGELAGVGEDIGQQSDRRDDFELFVARVEMTAGDKIEQTVFRIVRMQAERRGHQLFAIVVDQPRQRRPPRNDRLHVRPRADRVHDRKAVFKIEIVDPGLDLQPVEPGTSRHGVVEEALRAENDGGEDADLADADAQ